MSIVRNSNVCYPDAERAQIFINPDKIPFVEATVGITLPLATYAINRPATSMICVFEYILDGEGEIFIDGAWRRAVAKDYYILSPFEEQHYRANPRNPWRKIWINYSADYMKPLLDSYGVRTGIYRSETAASCFAEIFEISESENYDSETPYRIAERIHAIIAEASREARLGRSEGELRDAVATYINKKLDLDELSAELHMSKSSLIRAFKRNYGVTPYDYLLSLKIKSAKSLLRDTEMTVREISERLAISDEHYLSAMFRKRTGMRPGAYRKKYRI